MSRFLAAVLAGSMLLVSSGLFAQAIEEDKNAKSQGDIEKERERACGGLRDEALEQCRATYVGTSPATADDAADATANTSATDTKNGTSDSARPTDPGAVDMTKEEQRGPVAPTRESEPKPGSN